MDIEREEYIEDLNCLWNAISDPLESFQFVYRELPQEIELPFDLKVALSNLVAKEIRKELDRNDDIY